MSFKNGDNVSIIYLYAHKIHFKSHRVFHIRYFVVIAHSINSLSWCINYPISCLLIIPRLHGAKLSGRDLDHDLDRDPPL